MVNNIVLGLFSSLIAAVFLGIYPVPRKYVNFGINDYMISMTIGVFLSGFFISILILQSIPESLGFSLTYSELSFGLLAGSLWSIGTIMYVYSVDCMGVGRATPIKNITAVLGVLFGLIVFQEYDGMGTFSLISLAIGTILIVYAGKILGFIQGSTGISRPSCPINLVVPKFMEKNKKTALTAGWILALGAALLYGLTSISLKVLSTSTESVFQFLPIVGIGALLTSFVADRTLTSTHSWRREPVKEHLYAVLGGILWVIGFMGLTLGIKFVGLSISWPMAMSSTVFAVLYAILLGKEIDFSNNKKTIIKGLLVGIIGIALLGSSI